MAQVEFNHQGVDVTIITIVTTMQKKYHTRGQKDKTQEKLRRKTQTNID